MIDFVELLQVLARDEGHGGVDLLVHSLENEVVISGHLDLRNLLIIFLVVEDPLVGQFFADFVEFFEFLLYQLQLFLGGIRLLNFAG